MMFQRRDRKLNASHTAKLLGPEPARIHHIFTCDLAFICDHTPAIMSLLQTLYLGMFKIFSAPLFGGNRIGMCGSGGIKIPLPVSPHPAQKPVYGHDRVQFLSFFGGDQTAIINTD